MTTTHNHISLEAQMPDSIKLSAADKAAYCADAYLAVRKARNYIRDVERILDLNSPEDARIYSDMVQLRHDMFKLLGTLQDLRGTFAKEEKG